jgi:hypothetical protein
MNVVIINPGMIVGSGNWTQSSGELFQLLKTTALHFPEDLLM